jgi:hypothetical protein
MNKKMGRTMALPPVPPCVGFAGWGLGGMVGSALFCDFLYFILLPFLKQKCGNSVSHFHI